MANLNYKYQVFPPLLAVIVSAWGYLFYQHGLMSSQSMSTMWMPPSAATAWRLSDFILVYSMWAVMMAAMMLPSAIPVIQAFGKICLRQSKQAVQLTALFILAYFSVWLLFSVGLTLLQKQFHSLDWLSPMMESQSSLLSGGILILAGLYQFTPVKNACLKQCQTPFGFLLNHWQKGPAGAFQMGFMHGMTCLGCCWAEMLIMFSVGVMNLLAMALITLLVITEKTLPSKFGFFRIFTGVFFFGWGLLIVLF